MTNEWVEEARRAIWTAYYDAQIGIQHPGEVPPPNMFFAVQEFEQAVRADVDDEAKRTKAICDYLMTVVEGFHVDAHEALSSVRDLMSKPLAEGRLSGAVRGEDT